MKQVKLFYHTEHARRDNFDASLGLTEAINSWIRENSDRIDILNIVHHDSRNYYVVVMVTYEEKSVDRPQFRYSQSAYDQSEKDVKRKAEKLRA